MNSFEFHKEEDELIPENTDITQNESHTQPITKVKQSQTDDGLDVPSDPEATTSEPQQNENEPLLIKKREKRQLKNKQIPNKENHRLIQMVRCMRCLYDPQHPRHKDKKVCRDLWDIIGKAMGLPGNECEKRWSILRKTFKDIIKYKKRGNFNITKSLMWYQEYIQITIDLEVKKSLDLPHKSKCSCNLESHEIDVFLSGLLPTLKSLTPNEQDLSKIQIFKVINKYEQSSSNMLEVKEDMDWTE